MKRYENEGYDSPDLHLGVLLNSSEEMIVGYDVGPQ